MIGQPKERRVLRSPVAAQQIEQVQGIDRRVLIGRHCAEELFKDEAEGLLDDERQRDHRHGGHAQRNADPQILQPLLGVLDHFQCVAAEHDGAQHQRLGLDHHRDAVKQRRALGVVLQKGVQHQQDQQRQHAVDLPPHGGIEQRGGHHCPCSGRQQCPGGLSGAAAHPVEQIADRRIRGDCRQFEQHQISRAAGRKVQQIADQPLQAQYIEISRRVIAEAFAVKVRRADVSRNLPPGGKAVDVRLIPGVGRGQTDAQRRSCNQHRQQHGAELLFLRVHAAQAVHRRQQQHDERARHKGLHRNPVRTLALLVGGRSADRHVL